MALTVGEKIKNRRRYIKMSVEELAEKVGLSKATIYRYEKGDIEKVDTEVLASIAKALRTTPAQLMGWDDIPEKEQTIDLKDVLNRTVAFDGHTLDENDAELIKSLLENMVKNKD